MLMGSLDNAVFCSGHRGASMFYGCALSARRVHDLSLLLEAMELFKLVNISKYIHGFVFIQLAKVLAQTTNSWAKLFCSSFCSLDT